VRRNDMEYNNTFWQTRQVEIEKILWK